MARQAAERLQYRTVERRVEERLMINSRAGDSEKVYNHIIVVHLIFLVEVAIVFRLPKTACTHVESTGAHFKNNERAHELVVLSNLLLYHLDYLFA